MTKIKVMKKSLKQIIVIASLCLLLQSCMKVGPDFRPPIPPEQLQWIDSQNENIFATDDPVCCFWELFNDPVLNDLIHVAYNQNLPLKIAGYRILEARARLGIAVGAFFPQLQEGFGSATDHKLSKNQANIGPAPDIYFQDYQLGFQTAWELDFWGKYRRAIESERAGVSSSFANYNDVIVLLLSDVAAVYVGIRTLQERIAIVRSNIKIQKRSLEITEANFEGGFVSELDVQQAKTLLKGTESRIPDLERQLRQAENALSVLLGIPPNHLDEYIDGLAYTSYEKSDEDKTDCLYSARKCEERGLIPVAPSVISVSMPESILYRRPDIRQALYDAASQSARIGVAFSDFFPQISLAGTIGFRSSSSASTNPNLGRGSLLDGDSLTFSYGSLFSWPILNYGRILNAVKVEQALFYQLVVNYQNTVLQAYQEVEDGLIAFLKAQEQEKILSESVKAAKRSVELANTQYIEGLVDYTRVLNTQESQLFEQERHAIARGDIALGLISTYKALGGGFEISRGSCSQKPDENNSLNCSNF